MQDVCPIFDLSSFEKFSCRRNHRTLSFCGLRSLSDYRLLFLVVHIRGFGVRMTSREELRNCLTFCRFPARHPINPTLFIQLCGIKALLYSAPRLCVRSVWAFFKLKLFVSLSPRRFVATAKLLVASVGARARKVAIYSSAYP